MASTTGNDGRPSGQLELVGVDTQANPHALLLRNIRGQLSRLPLDDSTADALREAVRNRTVTDTPRLVEVSDETSIGPREIQVFIRSGMSAEDVAAEHRIDIEKIRRYETPVLMEREHMANRARTTELRKPHGQRTLEDVVTDRLTARGDDLASLEWDSWKRTDGRWTIEATWLALAAQIGDDQMASARWVFDPVGRTLVPDDAAARALMDDDSGNIPTAPTKRARKSGGDPYVENVADDLTAVVRATSTDDSDGAEPAWTPVIVDGEAGSEDVGAGAPEVSTQPVDDEDDEEIPVPTASSRTPVAADEVDLFDEDQRINDEFDGIDEPAAVELDPTPAPAAKTKAKRGRASVPSWDEILLGTHGPDNR